MLYYHEQLRIFKEIYESSPENLSYKNGLAISYATLAILQETLEELHDAITNMDMAYQFFKEVEDAFPENPSYQSTLAWAIENYERLRSSQQ